MQLPNYFLADLPPEAELAAAMLKEAGQTLKRNRQRYLADRQLPQLIHTISQIGERWLEQGDPFRKLALSEGPRRTSFSQATIAAGIDQFFGRLTAKNLRALILQDLGHLERAEELRSNETEQSADRASFVRGPELIFHIASGNLPNPTWTSMILGFLTKSAQFVKCASGASFLPRLLAHSVYAHDPKLGACLEVAEWKGGKQPLEAALCEEADCVTATGCDETIDQIRAIVPSRTRFLSYGHRLSFGYIARESLSRDKLAGLAASAVQDVIAWDQLGCLSPHLFYVEAGGAVTPEEFAESLAQDLEIQEKIQPRGVLQTEESAAIASRRAFYQIRAAHLSMTRLWSSKESTAWTVVFEQDPQFQHSCLNRFVYIKQISGLEETLHAVEALRDKVSTVGLAAPFDRAPALANRLAKWGVRRICPLGQMQRPPLTWRHDGRPALADLVTWTDWEFKI